MNFENEIQMNIKILFIHSDLLEKGKLMDSIISMFTATPKNDGTPNTYTPFKYMIKDKKKNKNEETKKTNQNITPNFLNAWTNYQWLGVSTEALLFPEEMLKTLKDFTKESNSLSFSLFHLKKTLKPLVGDKLKEYLHNMILDLKHKQRKLTVCNSLKLHFFYNEVVQPLHFTEIKNNFLYSSSIPLFSTSSFVKNNFFIGKLFNYNSNELQCTHIKNCRIIAHYDDPTELICRNNTIQVLNTRGPTKNHHDDIMVIAGWFHDMISWLCPESKSNFKNIRTFCRDYANSVLFQHLNKIFEYTYPTPLPYEILFYSLYNSICINNFHVQKFISCFDLKNMKIKDSTQVLCILRIIRDCIIPWTMCVWEGMYWSDTSLGQDIEDQPFPFSFLPGKRIFQKDDCEGRMSEVQQLVNALRSFALVVREINPYNIESAFEIVAEMYHSKLPDNNRLNISYVTWFGLVQCMYNIGLFLNENVLEVHTLVGDVNFASFNESSSSNSSENLSGHSFGILLYFDRLENREYAYILESTGWERTLLESDAPFTDQDRQIIKILSEEKIHNDKINICGILTNKKENKVYKNICIGNDCLFFSKNEDEENSIDSDSKVYSILNYGAELESFKQNQVFQYEKNVSFENITWKKNSVVVRISTENFMQEILKIAENIHKKKPHRSIFEKLNWIKINKESTTLPKFQSTLKQTEKIIDLYANYVEHTLHEIHECLATPFKQEKEYLALMKKNWNILEDIENYDNLYQKNGITKGVFFALYNDIDGMESLKKIISKLKSEDIKFKLKISYFMMSMIVNIYAE